MFVTYLGYRLERNGRNRIDIRDASDSIVRIVRKWDDAVLWIAEQSEKTDRKEKTQCSLKETPTPPA